MLTSHRTRGTNGTQRDDASDDRPHTWDRALRMETVPFIEGVRSDLEGLAAAEEAAVVERVARALEPSLQLRLFDAIGQAALELSEQLGSGHVDVRLAGRDVQLVFVGGG